MRHIFPQDDVAVAAGHGAADGGGAPHIHLCQEDQGGSETPGAQISNNWWWQCDSPQALSNRLASYAHSAAVANTDKQNFVAENVEKNEDGIQSS